jgi:chromosome segregation ATPase
MRAALALTVLLVATPLASDVRAQTPPRGEPRRIEAAQERRAELERQVQLRFVDQATERLGLDPAQRERLAEVLNAGASDRRALARESRQLRTELTAAVRDADTPPAAFHRLLDRAARLRDREQALERQQDAALAEFLDGRQRAEFMVMRMQLNEQVRGIRGGRPGGQPGGRSRRPDG